MSVSQPAGSTTTGSTPGNPFFDARWAYGLTGAGEWQITGHLGAGIGLPLACRGSDDRTCPNVVALADALSSWSETELHQRDALPASFGGAISALAAPWRLGADLRLPLFVRLSRETSPGRAGRPLGLAPTVRPFVSVAPASWFQATLVTQLAGWAPRLVGPVDGATTDWQFSFAPRVSFGIGNHVALSLDSMFPLGGPLSGSYAMALDVTLAY